MSNLHEISPIRQGVVAAFRDSPFATPGDYRSVSVRPGLSISDILEEVAEAWQLPYARVILNDEVIAQEDWPLTVPKQGDVLNIVLVPQGGDVGQIFKALAVIVVTVAVAWSLGPAGLAMVGPELAAGIGAAAGLVTGLALNALFPPPAPSTAQMGSAGVSEDPVYGFSKVSNQASPYGTIPRVYGRRRVMLQHAINPYVVSAGPSQYLYQCFTAGYGPLKIEDILIGDTPIGNYKDVEYFIHESFMAGDELKICKEDVWTDPYSINLLKNAVSTLQTTNDAEKVAVDIQFPTGLYQIDKTNGDHHPWTVDLSIEVAPVGSSNWVPVSSLSPVIADNSRASINLPVTSSYWEDVGSPYSENPNHPVVDVLPDPSARGDGEMLTTVSYSEEGVATYTDHRNHYTHSGASSTVRTTGQFTKPFFTTVYMTLPSAGHYQIRISRLSDDQDSAATAVYCNTYLSSIRSYRWVPPVAPDKPISLIEMKIKATDQLNGSVNNLSCIVTSKLPVYQNGNWQILETRNPAWAYLDVLRGTAIPRPVSDSRIDFDAFVDWANWCDQAMANAPTMPRAMCDLEVTSQTTVWEALKLIAGTGYATPSTAAGKHSIAIDRLRSTPVQLFTPRNIKGLTGELVYHIQPHALRVQYTPTDSTTADEVVVFDDGYTADGAGGTLVATNYETMKLVGISRYEQAFVIGRRSLAQGKLRIETFKISCDAENLLATRGDFVRLAHDVPRLGSGWGRVVAINGNTLTLDEDITASGTLYARIRTQAGNQFDSGVSSYTGASLTLSAGASGITVGDVVAYGNLDRVTMDCLVKSVRPSNDFSATLELVPYAPGIYTAEVSLIPPYDPYGGQWIGGTVSGGTGAGNETTPGQVTSLKASSLVTWENKVPRIAITLSWGKPASGGMAFRYKVYTNVSGNWVLIGSTSDLSYVAIDKYQFLDASGNIVNLDGKTLVFAVSAVGADGSSYPPETASFVSITPIVAGISTVNTLTAIGGVFEIILSWSITTTGFDIAFAEIWGAQNNNRGSATLVAKVAAPQNTYHHVGLLPGSVWYYWVRFIDGSGKAFDWYPISANSGVTASPSTDPAAILTQLDGAIDTTQLAEELNQRIDLIDGPDTMTNSVAWRLLQEATARQAAITTEATTRQTADSSLASQITTLTASINQNASAIQTEATTRANADSAEASLRTTLAAKVDVIEGNVATNVAAIQTEATTRANQDSALATQITTVSAAASKTRTYSQASAPTSDMVNGDLWFDTDANNKAYRYNGSSWVATDDTRIAANAADIQTEATTRANGDSANATLINQVQARLDTGDFAAVKVQSSANADKITGLNAKYSVQVDANGGVVGFVLNSNGQGSGTFTVNADYFKVYKPGYIAMPIFQVGSINGVSAVGINGNLVVDGTIVTNSINGNAVTVSNAFVTPNDVTWIQTNWVAVCGGYITTSGNQPVTINFATGIGGAADASNYNTVNCTARFYVYIGGYGKTIIGDFTVLAGVMQSTSGLAQFTGIPAGTYYAVIYAVCPDANGGSIKGIQCRYPGMTVLETKR